MAYKKEQRLMARENNYQTDEVFNKINKDAQLQQQERSVKLRNENVKHWQDEVTTARQMNEEEKILQKLNKNKIMA